MGRYRMFKITDLYNLFKPLNNENKITNYPLIFGGTQATINTITGGFILTQISSQPIGSQVNQIIKNDDGSYSNIQKSLTKNVLQLDFYKQYFEDDGTFVAVNESKKMMEYLKSYETLEYLKKIDCEMLPNYSSIQFLSEYTEQKSLVNRASFDFSIISYDNIILDIIPLGKVKFEKEIII